MKAKKFLQIALMAVCVLFGSAYSANAQVINPETAAADVSKADSFWFGDTFFEWNGHELVIVTVLEGGPVRLSQAVLNKDGSFGNRTPYSVSTEVFNPARDWQNTEAFAIGGSNERQTLTVYELNRTLHLNQLMEFGIVNYPVEGGRFTTAREYLLYDVIIEKNKLTLCIHKAYYADDLLKDITLHERVFIPE